LSEIAFNKTRVVAIHVIGVKNQGLHSGLNSKFKDTSLDLQHISVLFECELLGKTRQDYRKKFKKKKRIKWKKEKRRNRRWEIKKKKKKTKNLKKTKDKKERKMKKETW